MQDRRHASWLAGTALLIPVVCMHAACADAPPPALPEPVAATPIDDPPVIVPVRPPSPPPAPAVEETGAGVVEAPILTPDDDIASQSLEELNRAQVLEPVFFVLDGAELDERGLQVVETNAQMLSRFPTWNVTIEGHCDERGTAEYNLGLGERRALAVQQYLLQLGLDPARIRTVSYGKEFPFDPGRDEAAWATNRRAHFVITEK